MDELLDAIKSALVDADSELSAYAASRPLDKETARRVAGRCRTAYEKHLAELRQQLEQQQQLPTRLTQEAIYLLTMYGPKECPNWKEGVGSCGHCSACRVFKCVDDLERPEQQQQSEVAPTLYAALQLLQKHVHDRHCDPHPMGQSELCKVSSDALALANGVTSDESEDAK